MAMNRTRRWRRSATDATTSGSKSEMWFEASSTAPRSGMCSRPVMRHRNPRRRGRRAVYTAALKGSMGVDTTTATGPPAGVTAAERRRRDSRSVNGDREPSVDSP